MTEEKTPNKAVAIRTELNGMVDQFKASLPSHISPDHFLKTIMVAINNNPKIADCSRRSLLNACMRAAHDGLYPDGREGAIVPYKGEAQWMPMVGGFFKKAWNSGKIKRWDVQLVYQNDDWDHQMGSNPYINHRRNPGPRGDIIYCYSICVFKDGGDSMEIMSIDEVEAIHQLSRAEKGPWSNPTFYPEMVRKTVARRHAKRLPLTPDLEELSRRDDDLIDVEGVTTETLGVRQRRTLTTALDDLAGQKVITDESEKDAGEEQTTVADNGSGKVDAGTAPANVAGSGDRPNGGDTEKHKDAGGGAGASEQKGQKAAEPDKAKAVAGTEKKAAPKAPTTEAEYRLYAKNWIDASADGTTQVGEKKLTLTQRWSDLSEKNIRNVANVSSDAREQIFDYLATHVEKITSRAASSTEDK